jgi:alpha-tubulin suppressor-like RCC1 family protein
MRAFTWAASLLAASCLLLSGVPAVVSAAPEVQAADADTGSGFTAINPVRVLDTRNTPSPVGPGGTREVDLSSVVPASATAVVLNMTATAGTSKTLVTVFPHGAARPDVSNLIVDANETRPNSATVAVGADRKVDLYNLLGSVHLIVDVDGYYAPGTGAKFTPARASRLFPGEWNDRYKIGPGGTISIDFTDIVPTSATAVAINLTSYETTAFSHVIAWPSGSPRPDTSNLNVAPGKDIPNFVTVGLGPDRKALLFNAQGSVHLLVDFAGFYTPDYGAVFTPLTPRRVLDTRNGKGTWDGVAKPITTAETKSVRGNGLIPDNAIAAVFNLFATQSTGRTYLSAWQYRSSSPITSNVNVVPGQDVANLAVIEVNAEQPSHFYVYNDVGTTHAMADLTGYFWVPSPTPCTTNCVYIWGRVTGTGTTYHHVPTPRQQPGLSDIRAVSAHLALRADRTVVAWGENQDAQLGNGWSGALGTTVPVPVVGLTDVIAIASGIGNGYAVRSDGSVWAWGVNWRGQLGDGGSNRSTVPRQIPGLTRVKAVAAGGATAFALHDDGTVSAWGANESGQLGTGSPADYVRVPVRIPGLTGVTSIAAGSSAVYALVSDRTVWAWGANGVGQLGGGSTQPFSRVPVKVAGVTDAVALGGNSGRGMVVKSDGTAWAWGSARNGGLGTGADCADCWSSTPLRVAGLTNVSGIAASDGGGYASLSDGSFWAWGSNENAELGNGGGHTPAFSPVLVHGAPPATAINAQYGARIIVPTP